MVLSSSGVMRLQLVSSSFRKLAGSMNWALEFSIDVLNLVSEQVSAYAGRHCINKHRLLCMVWLGLFDVSSCVLGGHISRSSRSFCIKAPFKCGPYMLHISITVSL